MGEEKEINKTISTFETLEVWKEARELRNESSKLAKNLPSNAHAFSGSIRG